MASVSNEASLSSTHRLLPRQCRREIEDEGVGTKLPLHWHRQHSATWFVCALHISYHFNSFHTDSVTGDLEPPEGELAAFTGKLLTHLLAVGHFGYVGNIQEQLWLNSKQDP